MPREYKIVVFGSGGVGKSSLTTQFVQNMFPERYDPTIEDSFRKQYNLDGEQCMLEILDTAGTEGFAAMRSLYMKNGEGFLLVYSCTAASTFQDVDNLYEDLKRARDGQPSPVVLVGNKCDMAQQRVVPQVEGFAKARTWGAGFIETSARLRINVDEAFSQLLRAVRAAKPPVPVKQRRRCIIM